MSCAGKSQYSDIAPLMALRREPAGLPRDRSVALQQTHALLAAWERVLRPRVEPVVRFAQGLVEAWPGPVLCYVEHEVIRRMRFLRELSSTYNARFFLAVKSAPSAEMLDSALEHLDGFDVSNEAEYRRLPSHLRGRMVFVSSPVLPAHVSAVFCGEHTACVSACTLEQWRALCSTEGNFGRAVRLDSASLLADSGVQDAASYPVSRFGLNLEELAGLGPNLGLPANASCGFHVHHGSERNNISTYSLLAKTALKWAQGCGLTPAFLNLGGGLHELSLHSVRLVIESLREFIPMQIPLYFEPGRFLTCGSGFAVARIHEVREREGIIWATTDLSSECHLRWSNPNLLWPILPEYDGRRTLRLFGSTCYEADFLGQFSVPSGAGKDAMPAAGELLIFSEVSGYSAAWNHGFNGVAPADVRWLR